MNQPALRRHTIFIVDDEGSVRDSLALLLSLRGHATAVFANAEDFLAAVSAASTGCVIADIRMPGMSGLELQQLMQTRAPELPVIIITGHGDVAAARQAFKGRAVDFLEKPLDHAQLLAAIDAALATADATRRQPVTHEQRESSLSAREREVMQLLVRGLHNRAIAHELGISPRTVEVHKARVMAKMGAANLVQLIRITDAP